MFYYPNVLHRRRGCFSTIWLAATKGIKVTRREFLKVNVNRTCEDIVDYITCQVPPPQPTLPRPRFSLYLSSQLQYGVIVVYHRQCGFLLEEVQQTMDRLLRSKRCIPIDMSESNRLALDVPDSLFMMEEAEGAQDPFFGLMDMSQLPSPNKIHQPVSVMAEAGSQHSLVPNPYNTPDKQGFRSPRAAITLTERVQLHDPTAECLVGDDLPEATAREIDLLMDQPDHFPGEVDGQQTDERSRDPGAMTSIDQLKETMLGPERDSVCLPDQVSGQAVELPVAAFALEMTPRQITMPTPPSGSSGKEEDRATKEVAPPLRKKRGGRQLVFADPQTQISDEAMKEQIGNPRAETLKLTQVLLDLPACAKHAAHAQLFSAPCGSLLHPDLLSLWKQSASLPVLSAHGEDREILRAERKQSSMREISSDSGLHQAEGSSAVDVMLDMSKEDKSLRDVITPVSRWSLQEEAQLQMEPIAEENIEMPEAQNDAEIRGMLSWISSSLQGFGELTFESLLPPEASSTSAAQTLSMLLDLLSAGQLTARQVKPYSIIIIAPPTCRVPA